MKGLEQSGKVRDALGNIIGALIVGGFLAWDLMLVEGPRR